MDPDVLVELVREAIARDVIMVYCSWCGTWVKDKPAYGRPGVSHTMCDKCLNNYESLPEDLPF